MTSKEIKEKIKALQAELAKALAEEERNLAAANKANRPEWEVRTGHTTDTLGDSDHTHSSEGECWRFLIVPKGTPEIAHAFEGREVDITFVNGNVITLPEEWGCGETEQEAWASF